MVEFYRNPQRPARRLMRLWLVCGAALLTGCSSLGYYAQAIDGQLELLWKRRSITQVLAQDGIDPGTRAQLELLLEVREFSVTALALPDNDSYLSFVDLERDYVVWNVFAAPELSLDLHRSCFLLAGCFSYRGFFDAENAARFARAMREQGYETYIGGVAAYSTLGWFDDPVLSTMLRWDTPRLVRVIFHELAHQVVYARNDTAFNEAFATTVAEEGLRRWAAARSDAAALAGDTEREAAVIDMMLAARQALAEVYAAAMSESDMRRAKAAVFDSLLEHYAQLRRGWGGDAAYDNFMYQDMNNAKLASVVTYHDLVPAFARLLASVDGDLPKFYAAARRLARAPEEDRRRCLEALAAAAGGAATTACPAL